MFGHERGDAGPADRHSRRRPRPDLPHHTNEIAQSCAAHGATDPVAYARYWMHNGFLDFSGEKMSKSIGNVVLVHDLIKQYPGRSDPLGAVERTLSFAAELDRRPFGRGKSKH